MLCCSPTFAPVHLALVRLAAQLPRELGALGEAGGAERVALGDQPARGVHDPLPAVGGVLGVHELVAVALLGEAERLVGDQLVGGEAVVQLDDVDVLRGDLGLLVGLVGGLLGHVVAHDLDRVAVGERGGHVGDHRLADDLHRLVPQVVLVHEALAGHDHGARAVGGGRALQLGERVVDHLRVLDLLERVLVLELRVGVVHRVLVVLPADPGVVVRLGAVALHVLAAGVAEHLRRRR